MRKLLLLAVAAVPFAPSAVRAQDAARAVVEKAIAAHGGMEKLSKHRADKVQVKGVLVIGTREASFVAETTVQLPGQFKNVMKLTLDDRPHVLVQVLNGDQAWVTLDGQPQKVEAAALAEMRETMQLDRAVRLVPLLTDPTFQLEAAGEAKVGDRVAAVLRVTAKGRKELRMFFDRETGLLVKTEHKLDDKMGKEVRQEETYSDFRDLGGYRRPVKVTVQRDGKKVMEAELTEVKYFERLDDAQFAKP